MCSYLNDCQGKYLILFIVSRHITVTLYFLYLWGVRQVIYISQWIITVSVTEETLCHCPVVSEHTHPYTDHMGTDDLRT